MDGRGAAPASWASRSSTSICATPRRRDRGSTRAWATGAGAPTRLCPGRRPGRSPGHYYYKLPRRTGRARRCDDPRIPAIDLKDGACVRLVRGEMASATVFNDDPAAQARHFAEAGFAWLHVVDLDGAFAGQAGQRRGGRGDPAAPSISGPARRRHPRHGARSSTGSTPASTASSSAPPRCAIPRWCATPAADIPGPHRRRHRCARRPGRGRRLGRDLAISSASSSRRASRSRRRRDHLHRHRPRRRAERRRTSRRPRRWLAAIRMPVIASGGVASLDDHRAR